MSGGNVAVSEVGKDVVGIAILAYRWVHVLRNSNTDKNKPRTDDQTCL